jgi:hypothetical protein
VEGVLEPVYQKGVLVGHKWVFSDKMAEMLMKSRAKAAARAGGQFTDEQTINIKAAVVTKTAAEVAQTVRKVSPLIIAEPSNGSFRAKNEGSKFCKSFKNSKNTVSPRGDILCTLTNSRPCSLFPRISQHDTPAHPCIPVIPLPSKPLTRPPEIQCPRGWQAAWCVRILSRSTTKDAGRAVPTIGIPAGVGGALPPDRARW